MGTEQSGKRLLLMEWKVTERQGEESSVIHGGMDYTGRHQQELVFSGI